MSWNDYKPYIEELMSKKPDDKLTMNGGGLAKGRSEKTRNDDELKGAANKESGIFDHGMQMTAHGDVDSAYRAGVYVGFLKGAAYQKTQDEKIIKELQDQIISMEENAIELGEYD